MSVNNNKTHINVIDTVVLVGNSCHINEKKYNAKVGNWAIYIPDLKAKILHADNGYCHCTASSTPKRSILFNGSSFPLRPLYTRQDWVNALSKRVERRAAENYICSIRLYEAGIGPKVHGLCAVRSYMASYSDRPCCTAGIIVDNLQRYTPKDETTESAMRVAGVEPDRLRSCIRQQINGYVSDLNSVVGVMPMNAEQEVSDIEEALIAAISN